MIIDGRKVAQKRLELLKEKIDESGLYPRLATVLVGKDPGSQTYVRMKHEACERVHIGSVRVDLPEIATTEQVLREVARLNADPDIDGILVHAPSPAPGGHSPDHRCSGSGKRCRRL